MNELAPVLMVQGTASSVGKSTLVAGLCRLLSRQGVRVAPFKAQNMSNNAAVCADGGEIGRAQFAQALAAGVDPTVDMNPILLKPQPGGSQLVVRGRMQGHRSAAEYFGPSRRALWPIVAESLDRLRASYDLVIAEGAGSPAEINLRSSDLVNMEVALHARADVLLVADIDRGGVFASLLGTWEWLAPAERALIHGFVLNKFRGDPALLAPAPDMLCQRTGVPVIGVVPFLDNLLLPEEDAATLANHPPAGGMVEIAIVRLPHLANFDEFGGLTSEPQVDVRWITEPRELRAPDLVILPGSKATIADLLWLQQHGIGERIQWLVQHGTPVLGICGGYQMLGELVEDPGEIESDVESAPGLSLLPHRTRLLGAKRLGRTGGVARSDLPGVWRPLRGTRVAGYEIHVGQTVVAPGSLRPLLDLDAGPDGAVTPDGLVAGTYMHGLFERRAPRQALLKGLANARGFSWQGASDRTDEPFEALADVLASSLDLERLNPLRVLRH
jgi:adenosylcobyric acid synthase